MKPCVLCAGLLLFIGSQSTFPAVAAVSYANLDLPQGFSLIANPLNNRANDLPTVLPSAPQGTTIFKFDGVGFEDDSPIMVDGIGWYQALHDVGEYRLEPGEGVFIWLPTPAKVTFAGSIPEGTLETPIRTGFNLISSKVPQAGTLTQLEFPAIDGDLAMRWSRNEQRYEPSTAQFFEGFGWYPTEPTLEVGESLFLFRSGAPGVWTRTFQVDP